MSGNNGSLGPDVLKTRDGNVDIAIGPRDGKVVLQFYAAVTEVSFNPVNAAQFGKQMIDLAVVLGARVEFKPARREITREKRERLVTRATHVFRSMTEQGKPPAYIARNVVDTILSDID